MSKPIEGKPAFPSDRCGQTGLTERRYYIGQALMGICANPNRSHWKVNGAAAEAIKVADAVMQLLYPQQKETDK